MTETARGVLPDEIKRVLAEHRPSAGRFCVGCDWTPADIPGWRDLDERDLHEGHLADVLASLYDERLAQAEAKALEDFADEWDEDTEENKTRLGDMASEHYHAGGPSMPAIAARLKAASIRAALSGDAAPRADGDTR